MEKNWDNTEYSCHICIKNDGSCIIRRDFHDVYHKHQLEIGDTFHILLETDLARFCKKFRLVNIVQNDF